VSEEKLFKFMEEKGISAKIVRFKNPVKTIKESSKALGKPASSLVKSIVFHENEKRCVAIVLGSDRVSYEKLSDLFGGGLKIAKPDEVVEKIGFPAGGVPPFGFNATFIIDSRVMDKSVVYGGGGSHTCLVKVSPKEILRVTHARVGDISDS